MIASVVAQAKEEASRFLSHEIDIDHLFLALTIDAGPAGQSLRAVGVDIDSARRAVADTHSAQLASLGVDAELPQRPIHDTNDVRMSKRAARILQQADSPDRFLAALINEPSGLVNDILARLGIDPEDVTAQSTTPVPANSAFIPAEPDEVWALLADPERVSEWEPAVDGELVELVDREEGRRIAWRVTFPQVKNTPARTIDVSLAPTPGGTLVTTELSWQRGLVNGLLLPLRPLATRVYRGAINMGISRALR